MHPDAHNKALTTECVAKLKGNDAFWAAADGYMSKMTTEQVLKNAGITQTELASCLADKSINAHVANDMKSAMKIGVQGTPYIVVMGPNGQQFAIPGTPEDGMLEAVITRMLETVKVTN